MSKYDFYDESKESFEKFLARNLKSKISASSLKGLVNPEFDNVLFERIENSKGQVIKYETEILQRENNYYEFKHHSIPNKIDIRFGCELETCFVLNCNKNFTQEINEILENENIFTFERWKNPGKWQNLIVFHLRNNIIPFLSKEFINKFRFSYIYPGYHSERGIFLDMKNGTIVNEDMQDEGYRTLIFEPDPTINCDVAANEEYDFFPIGCEIVTPVLSSIEDLKILYNGLISKNCNQSNASMGFHVNVSAIDEQGNIVKLTKGMLAELIYEWIPYEKEHYTKLRGYEDSVYAQRLQTIFEHIKFIKLFNQNVVYKNDEPIKNFDIYKPYNIGLQYLIDTVNINKYLSMTHHKNNNVVEFRVFNSSVDINTLIQYTQDTISIFKNAIQRYIDNPQETLVKIQNSNLMYKHLHLRETFDTFTGTVDEFIDLCFYYHINFFVFYEKPRLFGAPKKMRSLDIYKILENGIKNVKMCIKYEDYNHIDKNIRYIYDIKVLNDNEFELNNLKKISLKEIDNIEETYKIII